MSLDPLSAALDLGKMAVARLWPDPAKQAEELRKLEEMHQKGQLAELQAHVKLMLAQVEVNVQEAKHKSVFVAGWRPFIGWVGGFSLAYAGVIHPLLMWLWTFCMGMGWIPTELKAPPFVESGVLGTIVTGMLGIGAMRSHDKKHNIQDR